MILHTRLLCWWTSVRAQWSLLYIVPSILANHICLRLTWLSHRFPLPHYRRAAVIGKFWCPLMTFRHHHLEWATAHRTSGKYWKVKRRLNWFTRQMKVSGRLKSQMTRFNLEVAARQWTLSAFWQLLTFVRALFLSWHFTASGQNDLAFKVGVSWLEVLDRALTITASILSVWTGRWSIWSSVNFKQRSCS